jgi:galactose mutarotase-like enzyme
MYLLENEHLQIAVSENGAELQSLFDKQQKKEWLWQADAQWWRKKAPILFPFIGALKNGEYQHEGKTYQMSKHGFARDMVFECELPCDTKDTLFCVTDMLPYADALTFVLASTPETLKIYPFEFVLKITYQLEGASLVVKNEVINQGLKPMFFSLGGHPAFNCPMDSEDWRLSFEAPEVLETYCIDLKNGLILPDKKSLPSCGKPLNLSSVLFEDDALVFENLNSKWVTLEGPTPTQQLRFHFEGFPLFAVWSPKGPFVCLEPWFGMADFTTSTGLLEEKYGVQRLEAGAVFKCQYRIELVSNLSK